VSVDRRFKFTFLVAVLLILFGFGMWYGFVREDGGAGEVAQDVIAQDELADDGRAGDGTAPEAAIAGADAPNQAMQEAVAEDLLAAVEPERIEQLPEGAAPAGEAVSTRETESGGEIAAVDPSGDTRAAPEGATAAPPPVFDTVRVEPTGDAVIAGRSYPGAVVELMRNGIVHDRLVANASGEFAFIPPPLPVGTSEIVLRVVGTDGVARQSEQSVTVVVADDLRTAPMVAMVAPNQPTVVLSRPEERAVEVAAVGAASDELATEEIVAEIAGEGAGADAPVENATSPDRQQVAAADAAAYPDGGVTIRIASVEAEAGGGLYVTGEAAPNATVRLYLNDTFIAPADAGSDGTVSFSIERGVRPGSYRVRLDQVAGETGSVISRAEILFVVPELLPELLAEAPVMPDATISPEPAEQVVSEGEAAVEAAPERTASAIIPEISTAVVERGDSLWRISRQVYGSGMRYTEIFEANQNQIRNPNLIYPGQLFVLPADPAREAIPEAPGQGVN
jgi:nucleoid-associated protein YgaU